MRYIVFTLLLLLVVNCSLKKRTIRDINSTTYQELLRRNEQWHKAIITLQGQARITVDTPSFSGNFMADILLRGKDSLLIGVSGPFGIPLGKVFVAEKRFVFHNQLMNQFFTGSKEDFNGNNLLHFPLQITEIHSVFTAQDRFDILKREKFELRGDMYYIEAANSHFNYHIWFDPPLGVIKKIEYFDRDSLLFYKEYDRFEKVNGVHFPKVINFVRPAQKQGMSIYFNELVINEPLAADKFSISISDNAKQIDLSLENQTTQD